MTDTTTTKAATSVKETQEDVSQLMKQFNSVLAEIYQK